MMINVYVEFMLFQKKDKLYVDIEKGSNLEDLLEIFHIADKVNDYFYVVNEINKMKTYILQDRDQVKIFTVMSGG